MNFFYGFSIGDLLNMWADMGVFAYLLPFLLIFALVYGILTQLEILGKNKGVNVTIALAMGLLALQFDYVSGFYASIFPYAGMGLAVLLVALIFLGLFAKPEDPKNRTIWLAIGGVILGIVIFSSTLDLLWIDGSAIGFFNALPMLVVIGGTIGVIYWISKT